MSEPEQVRVPDIGDINDVPVIEILVGPGDRVSADQALVTLESEKATLDVPAPYNGVVDAVLVAIDDRVSEGSAIVSMTPVEVAGEHGKDDRPQTLDDRADAPSTDDGESDRPGSEVPAPAQPPKPAAASDASTADTETPTERNGVQPPPRTTNSESLATLAHAGPSVRRFARELGVDLSLVKGTGPKGRIVRDDVLSFVRARVSEPSTHPSGGIGADLPPWPSIDFSKFGETERVPLSRIRRISGPSLARNSITIPHVTNFDEADVTDLETFRRRVNEESAASAPKVTMLAFVTKACVAALRQFPEFNASLDGDELILKRYFHIGFAADTPDGLVVPVVRDADSKGIFMLADEMSSQAARAREGKLSPGDMQGGCFSISSLGGIGGTGFTPIINAPEVAILGLARTQTRVVWNDGDVEPRVILPLSLSWDHRVVDGALAARFLQYVSRLLGDFRRISL